MSRSAAALSNVKLLCRSVQRRDRPVSCLHILMSLEMKLWSHYQVRHTAVMISACSTQHESELRWAGRHHLSYKGL